MSSIVSWAVLMRCGYCKVISSSERWNVVNRDETYVVCPSCQDELAIERVFFDAIYIDPAWGSGDRFRRRGLGANNPPIKRDVDSAE